MWVAPREWTMRSWIGWYPRARFLPSHQLTITTTPSSRAAISPIRHPCSGWSGCAHGVFETGVAPARAKRLKLGTLGHAGVVPVSYVCRFALAGVAWCHAWGGGAVLGVVPVPRGCGGMGAGGNSVFSVSRMQIADCGSCQGWGVGAEAWAASWLSCLGVAGARCGVSASCLGGDACERRSGDQHLDTRKEVRSPVGSADLRATLAVPEKSQWRSVLRKRFVSASSLI